VTWGPFVVELRDHTVPTTSGTFCRMRPDADRAPRPTLEPRDSPSTSRNYGVARQETFGIFDATHPDREQDGGGAMIRILGTLIVAIFVAVALLAWVTVPT
jgi:hypothetical protein